MSCTKPAPINAARSTKNTIRTHCVVVSPLDAMVASRLCPFILTPLVGGGHINDIKGCPTFTLGDLPARFTSQLGPNRIRYISLFIFILFITLWSITPCQSQDRKGTRPHGATALTSDRVCLFEVRARQSAVRSRA